MRTARRVDRHEEHILDLFKQIDRLRGEGIRRMGSIRELRSGLEDMESVAVVAAENRAAIDELARKFPPEPTEEVLCECGSNAWVARRGKSGTTLSCVGCNREKPA